EFSPKSFPKKLCTGKQENFLVKIENYQGLDLCVTSLERTVVDCLDKPNFAGGHEEMWRSLSMIQRLDLDKLFEYLTFLENSTLFAKTGFFLEQQKEVLGIDEDYLKFLQGFIPKKAHYFERTKREKGIYIKQWNLIVPEKMYHRLWEEPNESI
ncbi:MAG: transcriptional regulator, partial [Proteobacteria bacterium]|nr:transcriptional regulator [Pseudomonadota bacterium]